MSLSSEPGPTPIDYCASRDEVTARFAEAITAIPNHGFTNTAILNRADLLARHLWSYSNRVARTSRHFNLGQKIEDVRQALSIPLTSSEVLEILLINHNIFNMSPATFASRVQTAADLVFDFRNLLLTPQQRIRVKTSADAFRALKIMTKANLMARDTEVMDNLRRYTELVAAGHIFHTPHTNAVGVRTFRILSLPAEEVEKRLREYRTSHILRTGASLNATEASRAEAAARILAKLKAGKAAAATPTARKT